jgi:hypothetical protein
MLLTGVYNYLKTCYSTNATTRVCVYIYARTEYNHVRNVTPDRSAANYYKTAFAFLPTTLNKRVILLGYY